MSPRDYVGDLEHLILLAILRLGDEAYGIPILREIKERSGRKLNPGSIYPTLDRLERKGLVRSRVGTVTHERGGRAKRFFRLEPAGLERLRATRALLESMSRGFEDFLDQEA
jgi:DNA-binding PadR family transcriptional regulator